MSPTRPFDQIGRVVADRYRLVSPIGRGASAEVYLGEDTRLDRAVAVKVLHSVLASDERFLARFRAEAQSAASLTHPNIVAVYDWGEDEVAYLVTEYLGGGSLRAVLDEGHRLSPSQALVVGLEISTGLAHAHGRGLVHRDIKPGNILLDTDGHLRIADFGLARALAEASVTEPDGALIGTARYASPEQAQGQSVDGRGDVYALALVLVEAVTGAVPFAADTTIATLMGRIETDVEVPDELGALAAAVARAGRRLPADRPDAEEFRISLLAASERLPAPAPIPLVDPTSVSTSLSELERTEAAPVPVASASSPDAEPVAVAPSTVAKGADDPKRTRRRRPVLIALAAVLAAILGGGAVYASTSLRTPTFEVPELIGRQADDVEVIATQNDWTIVRRQGRRDGTVPGEILSTDPATGERLAEGGTLTLIVSEGNELTTMPAGLIGATEAEATAALELAGLEVSPDRRHDEDAPVDTVIDVDGSRTQVARGDVVTLVVSLGPVPREIPEFVAADGFDPIAAALGELKLNVERKDVFDDNVPDGHVIAVSPAVGQSVARDSTVEVTVSKGPETVAVPDIRGKSLADATAALRAVGLELGQQCCRADGTVIESDPSAGTVVRVGTSVNVFLRR